MSENLPYRVSYTRDNLYSEPIRQVIAQCNELASKGRPSGLKVIERAIKKYPRIPELHDLLSLWYMNSGKPAKGEELALRIIDKFPNYAEARIDLASHYLFSGNLEKVKELLGDFDLQALYPDKEAFYIEDAIFFERVAVNYFASINELDKARVRLENLKTLGDDDDVIETFQMRINVSQFNNIIRVKTKDSIRTTKTTPPDFTHHKEIQLIYKNECLNQTQIEELLALPRKTLIEDLEKALKDACERYTFFVENEDENINFCYLSLLLLGHLKAEESLPVVLEFLSQSEEVLEFYLDEFVNATLWQVLVDLGENQIEKLFGFLKKPNVYTFAKTAASTALSYIAIERKPILKQDIIDGFADLLKFFVERKGDENIYDETLNSLILIDILRIGDRSLLPFVKQMFDGCVALENLYGTYQCFEEEMQKGIPENEKVEYKSLSKFFEEYKAYCHN